MPTTRMASVPLPSPCICWLAAWIPASLLFWMPPTTGRLNGPSLTSIRMVPSSPTPCPRMLWRAIPPSSPAALPTVIRSPITIPPQPSMFPAARPGMTPTTRTASVPPPSPSTCWPMVKRWIPRSSLLTKKATGPGRSPTCPRRLPVRTSATPCPKKRWKAIPPSTTA